MVAGIRPSTAPELSQPRPKLSDMTDPDRRPMVPVPPPERPLRRRQAARIIVRAQGCVLLMADTDPGLPGSSWWVTPGGGVDGDETTRQAAARELVEETGLRVDADDFIGPIARREVWHGYSDQVLVQQEDFYLLDLPAPFVPDTSGFTPEEQITLSGHAWLTIDELAGQTVWPAELGSLMALDQDAGLIDWGSVEESTVPVELGHR